MERKLVNSLRMFHFVVIIGVVMIAGLGMPLMSQAQPAEPVTDSEITIELHRQLIESDAVSAHLIDIETTDGVVTLSGTVDHLLAKEQAEKIAENMKGVLDVENLLIVKPVSRTDDEIRDDVIDALAVDPATDSYEIKVSVDVGVVTLSGVVESMAEKKLAEDVVKGVKGVIGVANDIAVEYETERPDSEIEAEIERSLELNPSIEESLIDVTVTDGDVTLSGTVGSLAEKREATTEAWTAGVNSVDNNALVIEWWTTAEVIETEPVVFKTDEQIRTDVEDALLYEPEVVSTEVDVSVDDAVVILTGTVGNYNSRRVAEETARNIAGVERVKNYITVRLEIVPTDEEIAQDVRDALLRDPIVERFDISVSVVNQKVYLTGVVDTYTEKQQAEDVASRVNSVVDVENSITVDYEWAWKSDQAIREDIHSEFFWSPAVDGGDIVVTVNNGVATMTGNVDSWSEHSAAVENAFEGGASTVKSYLEVKNSPGSEDYLRSYDFSTYYDTDTIF